MNAFKNRVSATVAISTIAIWAGISLSIGVIWPLKTAVQPMFSLIVALVFAVVTLRSVVAPILAWCALRSSDSGKFGWNAQTLGQVTKIIWFANISEFGLFIGDMEVLLPNGKRLRVEREFEPVIDLLQGLTGQGFGCGEVRGNCRTWHRKDQADFVG